MTQIDDLRHTEFRRPQKAPRLDPLELMMAIIKKNPKGGPEKHIAAFNQATDDLAFFDLFRARWVSLEYNRLLRLAHPPTAAEIRRRKAQEVAERAQMGERIRESFFRRIWDFVITPDGKRAHECTLQQVADHFRSCAAAITAAGKGKMKKRTDSVFESPEAFMAALKRTGYV